MSPSRHTSLLSLALLFLVSCRKSESAAPPPTTDTLSEATYTITRGPGSSGKGYIALTPFNLNPARLMVMDGEAHLLLERIIPTKVLNFRRWDNAEGVRYTWFEEDPSLPGSQIGSTVIADGGLGEIKRVNLITHGSIPDTGVHELDGHDFILLSDDHYIAMAYVKMHVDNIPTSLVSSGKGYVINPVIQEVQGGQVIWQWEGIDYPEFYTTSSFSNDFNNPAAVQDYMHLNSLFIDPRDNSLICSFRSLSQVIKIQRQTGAILWRLGGSNSDFPLSPEMQFLRQHDVTLTDDAGTLLLFDNGDQKLRPYSRILELKLDEAAHTVGDFKAYNIPEPFSPIMGSVQKSGDRYFICGGSGNYVLDINYVTGEKLLELKSNGATYRAYKY